MTTSPLQKLKTIGRAFKRELRVYQLVLKDPRTPKLAKVLLGLAIGYGLLPFDLIPDFIPIIGHIDDVLIVPGLVFLALKLIPVEIVAECRHKVRRCPENNNCFHWQNDHAMVATMNASSTPSDLRRSSQGPGYVNCRDS